MTYRQAKAFTLQSRLFREEQWQANLATIPPLQGITEINPVGVPMHILKRQIEAAALRDGEVFVIGMTDLQLKAVMEGP